MAKLKLAIYWAAACGGCDVAVLDLHEKIFKVTEIADIVLWPIALDFKYADIKAMKENEIDITLFNGAVRNTENKEIAELLRKKSKIMVAFGSCSHLGGIPGLANVATKEEIFELVYKNTPSTDNPNFTTPKANIQLQNGTKLSLPEFYNTVKTLDQVVDVDYYMPGCPPAPKQIESVLEVIASGNLPPKGAVIGASVKTLCDECERKTNTAVDVMTNGGANKEGKKIKNFKRVAFVQPDPKTCFIEQGLICMGPATRAGCGNQCINSNMPCRGCYGPSEGVKDQGAKVLSFISSIIDADNPDEIDGIIDEIKDPLGTFYRFSLPSGYIKRTISS